MSLNCVPELLVVAPLLEYLSHPFYFMEWSNDALKSVLTLGSPFLELWLIPLLDCFAIMRCAETWAYSFKFSNAPVKRSGQIVWNFIKSSFLKDKWWPKACFKFRKAAFFSAKREQLRRTLVQDVAIFLRLVAKFCLHGVTRPRFNKNTHRKHSSSPCCFT